MNRGHDQPNQADHFAIGGTVQLFRPNRIQESLESASDFDGEDRSAHSASEARPTGVLAMPPICPGRTVVHRRSFLLPLRLLRSPDWRLLLALPTHESDPPEPTRGKLRARKGIPAHCGRGIS